MSYVLFVVLSVIDKLKHRELTRTTLFTPKNPYHNPKYLKSRHVLHYTPKNPYNNPIYLKSRHVLHYLPLKNP